ncbi:D-Ala-D-Ala carboxypeptidase family metallohydrolase [Aquamicrobium terrae]
MKSAGSRLAKGECRLITAALLSVLLASCSSTGDPALSVGMPGYNAAELSSASTSTPSFAADSDAAVSTEPQQLMSAEGDTELPDQVAFMPAAKPGASLTALAAVDEEAQNTLQAQATALGQPAPTEESQQAAAPAPETKPEGPAVQTASAQADQQQPAEFFVTATDPAPQAEAPKKKGFLASFFGASSASAAPAAKAKPTVQQAKPAAKPVVTLASAEPAKPIIASANVDRSKFSEDSLPGVRQNALFEIKRKSGVDDDSDIDLNEDEGFGSYQVASAAGLARLAPNGLLKQTESVDVACLKPSLVRVLKTIENHYGKKLVVTSGYRDPNRNKRARGAKNSLHMYCAAADIQMPGVSKWELANYLRSMPGRGGVGTYCHTDSVHVDVGPERDWNWRCRRRK